MRVSAFWLRLAIVALGVSLVAIPAPSRENPIKPEEKEKQLEEIKKKIAELQKQQQELEKKEGEKTSPSGPKTPEGTLPESIAKNITWRQVGPANMSGRITALAVNDKEPTNYYVASAGGGLLKTVNNGTTFDVTFDKQTSISIGDVAIAPSNPDIVWVGSGEANPRNSVQYGDGVYKSTDAGKTFTKMGLDKTYMIGKVLIHPKNPDIVYVGALGRLYGPNPERGLYKTTDGGKTWDKVLFVDDKTGVIDARLDPQDPETLIVAMWERKRDEFDGFFGEAPVPDTYGPIVTHGTGGGIFKSTDGGKKWKKLNDEKLANGLPFGKLGRIGLDYSYKTKGLLVAIIDTDKVGTGTPSLVYLGVIGADAENEGGAKINEVTEGGPSAKAGLKSGDIVTKADETAIKRYDDLLDYVYGKQVNDKIKLTVKRGDKTETLELTLGKRDAAAPAETTGTRKGPRTGGAGAAPAEGTTLPPVMGIQIAGMDQVVIDVVTKDSGAEKAGLKAGDKILFLDGKKIENGKDFAAIMQTKKAGDKVKVVVSRDGFEKTFEVTLAANPRATAVANPGATAPAQTPASGPTLPLPGFTPSIEGELKVAELPKDGVLEKAGIKVGDLVVAINGEEVNSLRGLLSLLRVGPRVTENARKAGDKVKVTFKNADGKEKEIEVALVDTALRGMTSGPARGATNTRPFGLGLGGQQANVQGRQGKDGFQTGGIFVSKDNGETWTRVNSLNARPMYFSVVRFDPTDDNTIYALADVPVLYKSTNGGKRFETVRTSNGVHADAHAFWINPANAKHLLIGCDGGFYVSYDKGLTWDHINTLALGQFYHVATDNRRPYRIYGGLQDNGSWGGPSNTLRRYGPVNEDWVYVSGGDGFVCRVDPNDPDLVYSESQNGFMSRRNFRTGEFAAIRPPRSGNDEALRFNWNTPFMLSHHNSSIFYCGAQFVFRSVKKGENLKQISPDLTKSKKGSLTQVAESPRSPDVLWAGTDDGNVWVTKDGGLNWKNVSENFKAAGLPGPRWVNCIEPSRDRESRAYVVFDAHRSDDDKPYVFVTTDFGETWKSLNGNLPTTGGSRVLREDIVNNDVLYLGTEFGAFVSLNRGESWAKMNGNLPTVRVDEFAQPTTANELVVGTHGRSIWVTDLTSIRQMKPAVLKADVTLFAPSTAIRWRQGVGGESPYSVTDRKFVGTNPARGATLEYLLNKPAKSVSLKIMDANGRVMRNFEKPKLEAGLHKLSWDLTAAPTAAARGSGGRQVSGVAMPGLYKVILTVDDKEYTQPLVVEIDPNAPKDVMVIEGWQEAEAEYNRTRRTELAPARIEPIKD
ncbi:MAG: PDZ domain-containing protein [Fimbriiglobus sp.]